MEASLEAVEQRIIQEGCTDDLDKIEEILIKYLEERKNQDEILWRQESRIRWLTKGEWNTRFFHQSMIQHHQHNRITFL